MLTLRLRLPKRPNPILNNEDVKEEEDGQLTKKRRANTAADGGVEDKKGEDNAGASSTEEISNDSSDKDSTTTSDSDDGDNDSSTEEEEGGEHKSGVSSPALEKKVAPQGDIKKRESKDEKVVAVTTSASSLQSPATPTASSSSPSSSIYKIAAATAEALATGHLEYKLKQHHRKMYRRTQLQLAKEWFGTTTVWKLSKQQRRRVISRAKEECKDSLPKTNPFWSTVRSALRPKPTPSLQTQKETFEFLAHEYSRRAHCLRLICHNLDPQECKAKREAVFSGWTLPTRQCTHSHIWPRLLELACSLPEEIDTTLFVAARSVIHKSCHNKRLKMSGGSQSSVLDQLKQQELFTAIGALQNSSSSSSSSTSEIWSKQLAVTTVFVLAAMLFSHSGCSMGNEGYFDQALQAMASTAAHERVVSELQHRFPVGSVVFGDVYSGELIPHDEHVSLDDDGEDMGGNYVNPFHDYSLKGHVRLFCPLVVTKLDTSAQKAGDDDDDDLSDSDRESKHALHVLQNAGVYVQMAPAARHRLQRVLVRAARQSGIADFLHLDTSFLDMQAEAKSTPGAIASTSSYSSSSSSMHSLCLLDCNKDEDAMDVFFKSLCTLRPSLEHDISRQAYCIRAVYTVDPCDQLRQLHELKSLVEEAERATLLREQLIKEYGSGAPRTAPLPFIQMYSSDSNRDLKEFLHNYKTQHGLGGARGEDTDDDDDSDRDSSDGEQDSSSDAGAEERNSRLCTMVRYHRAGDNSPDMDDDNGGHAATMPSVDEKKYESKTEEEEEAKEEKRGPFENVKTRRYNAPKSESAARTQQHHHHRHHWSSFWNCTSQSEDESVALLLHWLARCKGVGAMCTVLRSLYYATTSCFYQAMTDKTLAPRELPTLRFFSHPAFCAHLPVILSHAQHTELTQSLFPLVPSSDVTALFLSYADILRGPTDLEAQNLVVFRCTV